MKKIALAIILLYTGTANATMIYDYDYYKDEGILQDVLDKVYIETEKNRTKKVIKKDRKLTKFIAKDASIKKVSRKEAKIAKTITKMDIPVIVSKEASTFAEIPEPSPLLLIGLGLVGLGISRKFLNAS